jgi:hypothetical protein
MTRVPCWALLAEIGDNFPASGRRLNWSDLWAYGLVALVAAVVAAAVIWLRNRNDMTRHCDNPWKLFRELCRVHELDRPSQRMLAQLAKVRRYAQPAEVFVRPAAFDLEGLPPAWRHERAALERLRGRLF